MSDTALRLVAAAAMTIGIGFVGAGQAAGADCSVHTPCAQAVEPQLVRSAMVRERTRLKPRDKDKSRAKTAKGKKAGKKARAKKTTRPAGTRSKGARPGGAARPTASSRIENEIKAVLEAVNRITSLKDRAPNLSTLDVSGVGLDQDLAGLPGSSAFPSSPASTRRLASELPELPVTPDPVTGRLPGPLPAVNVKDPVGVELDRALDVKADKSGKKPPRVKVLDRPDEAEKVPFLDTENPLTDVTKLLGAVS